MRRSDHVLIIVTLAMTLTQLACTADLRPSTIAHLSAVTEADQAKGRQMLKEVAKVHGSDRFDTAETYQIEMQDTWVGFIGSIINPWPDATIDVRLSYRPGTFDGRAELLSGSEKGTVWGIQSWKTYTEDANGNLEFEENGNTALLLPALQYFIEFPFRAHKDTVVVYAGSETIKGKLYERVFVTWKDLEPTTDHDQYVAYINPESGRIEKLSYTIRDLARAATGAIHFEDFKEVDGVQIPFTLFNTLSPEDDLEDFTRHMSVKSAKFDSIKNEVFIVDSSIEHSGDAKPCM